MKTKHTKGNLSIHTTGRDTYIVSDESLKNSNHEKRIAKILKSHVNNEEFTANAKLMAAAPDMLNELIRVREWVKINHKESKLLDFIEPVIKKATE